MAHTTVPRAALFCSLHILTSTMIYYGTVTWQHKIYLSNGITIHFAFFSFFCLFAPEHMDMQRKQALISESVEKNNHQKQLAIAPIKW